MGINPSGQKAAALPNASGDCFESASLQRRFNPADSPMATQAQALWDTLRPVVQRAGSPQEDYDLALAKALGARDFNTERAGGTCRNVLSTQSAIQSDLLRAPTAASTALDCSALNESGLVDLIRGRDHLVITHGDGPDAAITVVFNDSVNKQIPTALAVWREGQGVEALQEGMLRGLFKKYTDRIVLGPITQHATYHGAESETQRDALYHEAQSGANCPLHAMNNMAGKPIVSKGGFDQFLIEHRLEHFRASGVSEDDFYRNLPLDADLSHLYDFDTGIQPDVLEHAARALLPGRIKTSAPSPLERSVPGVADAKLIDFAEETEQTAAGCMLYANSHFIAFRKVLDAQSGASAWFMIDSARDEQPRIKPSEYLLQVMDNGPCSLIAWTPEHASLANAKQQ